MTTSCFLWPNDRNNDSDYDINDMDIELHQVPKVYSSLAVQLFVASNPLEPEKITKYQNIIYSITDNIKNQKDIYSARKILTLRIKPENFGDYNKLFFYLSWSLDNNMQDDTKDFATKVKVFNKDMVNLLVLAKAMDVILAKPRYFHLLRKQYRMLQLDIFGQETQILSLPP